MSGVLAVGFASYPPLPDWCCPGRFERRETPDDPQVRSATATWNSVTPEYFDVLGIRFVAGRAFDERDGPSGRRVVVINDGLARRLWPARDPVGMTVVFNNNDYEVVGVARYRHYGRSDRAEQYAAFFPARQAGNRMFVRVAGDPYAALPGLRQVVTQIDPRVPISEELVLADMLKGFFMPVWMAGAVASGAAAVALVLSVVGLYGVLPFSVRKRVREIGIRMALDADRRRIVRLILGEGSRLVLVGGAVGMAAAWGSTRLLSAFLYGVTATDTRAYLVAPVIVAAAALLGAYLPARWAARIEVSGALRHD